MIVYARSVATQGLFTLDHSEVALPGGPQVAKQKDSDCR